MIWAKFWSWKNHQKLTLIRLKFCSKRVFSHVSKIFKKLSLLFYVKKTIKECPVPLDISIKSNRKHHKTVLYSKSNKNMLGQLFGRFFVVFWQFFHKNISPCKPLSFHLVFINLFHVCINAVFCVLLNQDSTGLFVSYSSKKPYRTKKPKGKKDL